MDMKRDLESVSWFFSFALCPLLTLSPLTVFHLWHCDQRVNKDFPVSIPFFICAIQRGKETQMKWYPLICESLRSPGPYKNPWTSKEPWPVQNGAQRLSFLSDTKGFGVTTSRTVPAPLKGVVKETRWSWSSVLSFKHVNGAESAEVTLGVCWDCCYLYECNTSVASVFDEYSVG